MKSAILLIDCKTMYQFAQHFYFSSKRPALDRICCKVTKTSLNLLQYATFFNGLMYFMLTVDKLGAHDVELHDLCVLANKEFTQLWLFARISLSL